MFEFIEGLYFVTCTNYCWQNVLESSRSKAVIMDSFDYFSKRKHTIYGFVIMPNHIHFIISFNLDETPIFKRNFLRYTSQRILELYHKGEIDSAINLKSTQSDRNLQVWERRSKWIPIRTEKIFYQKLSYIHNNPLQEKWRLSLSPESYEFSSARSYSEGKSYFPFLTIYE